MNADNQITPIIIEQYCLGLLPHAEHKAVEQQAALAPDVKLAIDRYMDQLEQRLLTQTVEPSRAVKTKTLLLLNNLKIEQYGSLNERPVLNQYSDYKNWLRLVKPLLPEKLEGGMFVHEIRNDSHLSQTVIWTAVDYPDEVHTDVQESFMILEGRCRCSIDVEAVELGSGDFLEIPLHKHHDVKVLQIPVLAVVQRLKII